MQLEASFSRILTYVPVSVRVPAHSLYSLELSWHFKLGAEMPYGIGANNLDFFFFKVEDEELTLVPGSHQKGDGLGSLVPLFSWGTSRALLNLPCQKYSRGWGVTWQSAPSSPFSDHWLCTQFVPAMEETNISSANENTTEHTEGDYELFQKCLAVEKTGLFTKNWIKKLWRRSQVTRQSVFKRLFQL